MEKTYNPALIQRTQRYMETHSISQNQFAAKVNLSSAALSSYLNQKYKGSVEAVERQLSEFFKLDEEAEAAAEKTASLLPRAAYVPTSISEDVCQSIRFAQLEHCMVVLHGDAGVGKSKGAQKFLRDHPTNAVGISITPSTGTLNGSIKLLARALRVPECRNKMDQMMALRSRLDGTNWVIVIDEAQHLKYAALEEIRSLTDDNPMTGEHGVGVVLIGNSEVYSRLQGRQQAQFAQLFSRIRMQREYTTRKVKEDDVRKLFPVLAEQDARNAHVQRLHDRLLASLQQYSLVRVNSPAHAVPHIVNVSVTGVKGTRFQQALSEQGVCVSVKSACSSDGLPSKAVFAVSRDRRNALSSWRISISHLTTDAEIDGFLQAFDTCYKTLTNKEN